MLRVNFCQELIISRFKNMRYSRFNFDFYHKIFPSKTRIWILVENGLECTLLFKQMPPKYLQ